MTSQVMWRVLLAVAVLSTTIHAASKTEANDVTISPKMAQVETYDTVNITCSSNFTLKNCEFRVWLEEFFYKWDVPIDSTGNSSHFGKISQSNETLLFNAKYDGEGLAYGRCVLRMDTRTPGRHFVGCRVQGDSRGWKYNHMAIVVPYRLTNEYALEENFSFKKVVAEMNKKTADIEFAKTESWHGCELYFNLENMRYSSGTVVNKSHPAVARDNYSALWKTNACVASLNVTQNYTGILWCLLKAGFDYVAFDLAIIQVQAEPKSVDFKTSNITDVGQNLTATCTVEDSRPVARIVWMLGDEVVRNVSDDDDDNRAWSWPWDVKSITQVLTRKLKEEDFGKNLTCKVFYPNASVCWREKSVLVGNPKGTGPIISGLLSDSNTGTLIIVVVVLLLLAVGAVIVFVWLRRKRTVAAPIAAVTKRGMILEENDLYQSSSFLQEGHTSTDGARQSIFTDSPYEEVDVPVSAPPDAVLYEEIIVAPPASDAIPVACGVTYSRVVVR